VQIGQRHRLAAVGRLGHHLDLREASDEVAQAGAHQVVIVGDEHADRLGLVPGRNLGRDGAHDRIGIDASVPRGAREAQANGREDGARPGAGRGSSFNTW
jgi:hypothetical protein